MAFSLTRWHALTLRSRRRRAAAGGALASVALALALTSSAGPTKTAVFLPGTQPGSVDTVGSGGVLICRQCHASSAVDRPVTISSDWAGGMMAHAARDPVFYAALAVANKYATLAGNNVGEFCIRCHSPMGWLAGRSEEISGRSLRGTDLDGIQCDYCHRAVDPVDPDTSAGALPFPVPGYGNGMHVLQRGAEPKRGPIGGTSAPHATAEDPFQTRSEFCAVCHEVSNPFLTTGQDRINLPPHAYAPMERTYSEWLMSAFAGEGDSATCQGCHMTSEPGYICVYTTSPLRAAVPRHDLTGGNTFVPGILADFYDGLDTAALRDGSARARATLARAADLALTARRSADSVVATVRVTNRTGHKLPTGYPDGRRLWVELVGFDAGGDSVFHSGAYDRDSARLVGDPPARVYEAVFALTPASAALYGLTPGASFHFALNDTLVKDNRIPPRGFTNDGFASRLAAPVGATYADGQYWDEITCRLPANVVRVAARLHYQTISREYIEFLRDENTDNFFDWNAWGEKLHDAWASRGRSSPELIGAASAAVADSTDGVGEPAPPLPGGFTLGPNYPNPFNPATRIAFTVPAGEVPRPTAIEILDITGHVVASLGGERLGPGRYERTWDAAGMPSGVYFCRVRRAEEARTIKMLLLR